MAVGVGGSEVGVGDGGSAVGVGVVVEVASGGGVAVITGTEVGVNDSVGANRAVIV